MKETMLSLNIKSIESKTTDDVEMVIQAENRTQIFINASHTRGEDYVAVELKTLIPNVFEKTEFLIDKRIDETVFENIVLDWLLTDEASTLINDLCQKSRIIFEDYSYEK